MATTQSKVQRLITLPFLAVVRIYQYCISPFLPQSCRYYPTCSEYAVEALRVHGPLKGLRLAAWRICRCNPWSSGGIDLVPDCDHRHT